MPGMPQELRRQMGHIPGPQDYAALLARGKDLPSKRNQERSDCFQARGQVGGLLEEAAHSTEVG